MERGMRRLGRLAAALAIVSLLGAAGAAWGESLRGKALVLGKDLANRTISVSGGKVLHVSPSTAFADASGGRITLADLPVAKQEPGGMYEVSADATILWEGTRSGGRIVVHRVQMAGEALE